MRYEVFGSILHPCRILHISPWIRARELSHFQQNIRAFGPLLGALTLAENWNILHPCKILHISPRITRCIQSQRFVNFCREYQGLWFCAWVKIKSWYWFPKHFNIFYDFNDIISLLSNLYFMHFIYCKSLKVYNCHRAKLGWMLDMINSMISGILLKS